MQLCVCVCVCVGWAKKNFEVGERLLLPKKFQEPDLEEDYFHIVDQKRTKSKWQIVQVLYDKT
jgi:hypothetical protein